MKYTEFGPLDIANLCPLSKIYVESILFLTVTIEILNLERL